MPLCVYWQNCTFALHRHTMYLCMYCNLASLPCFSSKYTILLSSKHLQNILGHGYDLVLQTEICSACSDSSACVPSPVSKLNDYLPDSTSISHVFKGF